MNAKRYLLSLTLICSFNAFAGQEFRTLKDFSAQGVVFPASRQENQEIYCYLGVGDVDGKLKPKESSDDVFEAAILPEGSILKVDSVKKTDSSRSIIIKMSSDAEKMQVVIQCKPKQVELFSQGQAPDFDEVMNLFSDKDLSR